MTDHRVALGLALLLPALGACRGCAEPLVEETEANVTPPAPQTGAWIPADAAALPRGWTCVGDPPPMSCFAAVPGGTFLMGAQSDAPGAPGYDPDAQPNEGPVHTVTVSPFWMLRHEVTGSQVDLCIHRGWCDADSVVVGPGSTIGDHEHRGHPANMITWAGASRFCAWLSARLPTEAEWEFAARGTDGRRYPWGDAPGCGTGGNDPSGQPARPMSTGPCVNDGPVDMSTLRGDSPFGISGMAGNVWEWVQDGYVEGFYDRGTVTDPVAPPAGPLRIQRGGGWTDTDPVELRSAGRLAVAADARLPDTGFRCVWVPPDRR